MCQLWFFFSSSFQVVHNGKIMVFTLVVKEISVHHTGENLKEIILEELQKYQVSAKNIYSVTSDGGSNLVKAIRLIDNASYNQRQSDEERGVDSRLQEEDADDPDDDVNESVESVLTEQWNDIQVIGEEIHVRSSLFPSLLLHFSFK
jgi:hypothetical protein